MRKPEKQGIQAIVRPLQTPGQGDTPKRFHVLYVRRADEETARAFLAGLTGVNDGKF